MAGLDLQVPQGQVIGILGPNGAGKTTSIKMMCGLLRPTRGHLRVLGFEPAARSFEFLRAISVVFGQKSMLWWDVSCYASLLVHKQMYDLGSAQFHDSVTELAELLDLGSILHVPVRKLSLGQRMRCELMLALLHRPRLLFADEPTVGLDVVAKVNVRSFLAEINARLGTTIVLTSHDMDDVEALCKRVILIARGTTRFDGDLATLTASVRPTKQVWVTYAEPALMGPLPGAGSVATRHGGRLVELEVRRADLAAVLGQVTAWGRVVDLQVHDAGLAHVMADVFGQEDGDL